MTDELRPSEDAEDVEGHSKFLQDPMATEERQDEDDVEGHSKFL